jgi:predicted nucleotidyltransferase
MYKLKLTNLQQNIVRLLSMKAGFAMNQRKISKLLAVSAPAVMKAMPVLKREGLVKVQQDKESRRWAVELNLESRDVIHNKRADNLRLIYESGLASILEREFAGSVIILFGSYSRGDDISTSDIDIAVIGRKPKEIDLSSFEKILERKISLNFYPSFDAIHKNLKENLCNGIVLFGGVRL